MDIEKIKNRIGNKKVKNSYLKNFIIKTMILTIIFLITIIFIKTNDKYKTWLNKNIFEKNISFSNIKTTYNKYFGSALPFDKYINIEPVFNEKLSYKNINKYKDGIVLTVDNKYLVPIQYSGIVVFIGEKEEYGNTIIIESNDVSIWYSNIENLTVNLYDYVDKGKYLGETIDNKLYLVFTKEGKLVDYKKYI